MASQSPPNAKRISLSPKALYQFLVMNLSSDISSIPFLSDDDVRTPFQKEPDTFKLLCYRATDDELKAIQLLRHSENTKSSRFPWFADAASVSLSGSKLTITITNSYEIYVPKDGKIQSLSNPKTRCKFLYYGDGKLYCSSKDSSYFRQYSSKRSAHGKIWPCTLKDLFSSDLRSQNVISYLILKFFARKHYLWNDLAQDLADRSAYSAIPLSEVWEAFSRAELLQKHYGMSLNRNNREPIGYGIFYIQAHRIVQENEIQKLFGFNPGHIYIGRKKADLIPPLAKYILENTPDVDVPVRRAHGYTVMVNFQMIEDALEMAIDLRRKVSLTFHSPRAILDWHDELSRIYRSRNLSTVQLPPDSKFKKLKLPSGCVRLTSRRQFIEEGDFQKNCVTSYIRSVNNDTCSIWSMRKEDGTRNTIEIRCRTSKNNPEGYYYIQQMFGFSNSDVSDEDYELIHECISRQLPYKGNEKSQKS